MAAETSAACRMLLSVLDSVSVAGGAVPSDTAQPTAASESVHSTASVVSPSWVACGDVSAGAMPVDISSLVERVQLLECENARLSRLVQLHEEKMAEKVQQLQTQYESRLANIFRQLPHSGTAGQRPQSPSVQSGTAESLALVQLPHSLYLTSETGRSRAGKFQSAKSKIEAKKKKKRQGTSEPDEIDGSSLMPHAQVVAHETVYDATVSSVVDLEPSNRNAAERRSESTRVIGRQRHECTVCGNTFRSANTLSGHMESHFGPVQQDVPAGADSAGPASAADTDDDEPTNEMIQKHITMVTGGTKRFACTTCPRKFKDSAGARKHVLIHLNPDKFHCKICGKRTKSSRGLDLHMRIHSSGYRIPSSVTDLVERNLETPVARLRTQHRVTETTTNHRCRYCGNYYCSWTYLREHMKMHLGIKKHNCSHCSKQFTSRHILSTHVSQAHTKLKVEKRYQCRTCGKWFLNPSSLRNHSLVHTDERPYHCLMCSKRFRTAGNLNVHSRKHSGDRPYVCPTCGKSFSYPQSCNAHVQSRTCQKPAEQPQQLRCEQCDRSFYDLDAHVRSAHPDDDGIRCEDCGKSFGSKTDHDRHQSTHTGTAKYCCADCELGFTAYGTFMRHQLEIHGKGTWLVCDVCSKKFVLRSSLDQHMKNHREDHEAEPDANQTGSRRRLVCAECGKGFARKIDHDRHQSVHTGIANYTCPKCGMRFKSHTKSKRHQLQVHDEGDWQICRFCGKRFVLPSLLRQHVKLLHTSAVDQKLKDNLYLCKECGKKFRKKADHDRHQSVHTGVPRYGCRDCEMRFKSYETLKRHEIETHNRGQWQTCATCCRQFVLRSSLMKHAYAEHGQEPAQAAAAN